MNSLPLDMRIWRATYRLTQQAAADEAGVSLSSWKRYETVQTAPVSDQLEWVRHTISRPPRAWCRQARRDHLAELEALPF